MDASHATPVGRGNRSLSPPPSPWGLYDEPEQPTAHPSLLLKTLPLDVLVYLCREHLPPWSAIAFAITCRGLYFRLLRLVFSNGSHRWLPFDARQELLLALEKDASHQWWYCYICKYLHPVPYFFPSGDQGGLGYKPDIPGDAIFSRCPSTQTLTFMACNRHARLVLNHHRFGAGWPLATLEREELAKVGPFRVVAKRSAKIIRDELYLSFTLHVRCTADEEQNCIPTTFKRNACPHTLFTIFRGETDRKGRPTMLFASTHYLYISLKDYTDFHEPGEQDVHSCLQCPTDFGYEMKAGVENIKKNGGGVVTNKYWTVTIRTYHRAGNGHEPRDPLWMQLSSPMPQPLWECRNTDRFPHGHTKLMWDSDGLAPLAMPP
ncbi:hypothetical protein N0V88_002129 [Collariella sp. IMI 366227]|nr:hypothetical protein N0V88_002129 [Collariella sp. IMI 366227]